ncbi:MAG: hypothetical protein Q4C06_07880 [Bacillota bacterium]|nr:hypothetical protein [Bacillota bacterium]
MLIYIIIMTAIAVLLYQEGQKLLTGNSTLLQEFCSDPFRTKQVLRLLRRLCLTAAASAVLMLLCYILHKATGTLYKPLAISSILLYTAGFIAATLQTKNL